ncbi:MAG: acetolactate synthase small subunit [Candidatus Sumerlaeota bacterium]|nr:acetolactate synthase small subunit [Candidatus Sumerlaeota bacterium]
MADLQSKNGLREHEHVISVLVENRAGVLARISGMFSARGFNIDSLTVGETADPTVSRMTITARGDDSIIEQIIKQLRKLIDVIRVVDLSHKDHVDRELVLVKVKADKKTRGEIVQITEIFRAKTVDVSHEEMTIEVVGDQNKISAILDMFRPFGILEVARTGRVAMFRGAETLKL